MGMGRGVMEGVQMAGNALTSAMHQKEQRRQFDAGMAQRDKHHQDAMEQNYDRMALDKAWVDRFTPGAGESTALPPDVFPRVPSQPTPSPQPSLPPDAFPRVPQSATPAQALLPARPPAPIRPIGPSVQVTPNMSLPSPYEIRPRFKRY